ncbi:helix-turn-helix domain-containing protein [Chondromyces apiculatus]|uniref:helix-turn-helix domain-containing protein n=1 Tax=Chondromyces apiculatus TaxID=51 RepID=UPI00069388BB|nr:XRE family transcriptional regulator [Chondromyces apiculatus]
MAQGKQDIARFIGRNLQVARTFHGLTLSDLGDKVGSSHTSIANYESGARQPGVDVLDALCASLKFERQFFFTPLKVAFNEELFNFRKRLTTPLYVRNKAIAHGVLFVSLIEFFDSVLDLPTYNVPEVRCTVLDESERAAQIEKAAETCRFRWALGDRPVSSVTDVLENAGIVVTRLNIQEDEVGYVDAFSHATDRGIIVVNAVKGASRTIFDLGHELGHLVMHGGMVTGTKPTEDEANQFASAFLLPRVAMFREFPRPHAGRIDWDAMLAFKHRWRVSLQATLRRARDLHLIDAATYLKATKYISYRGWLKSEPGESPVELPGLISSSFDVLKQEQAQNAADIATQLHWYSDIISMVAGVDVSEPPTSRTVAKQPLGQLRFLKLEASRRS